MINVYSKSESELGRLLSNFAKTSFVFSGRWFQSVEAFWYWYMTGEESLKKLWGYRAKQEGKKYPNIKGTPPRHLLKNVYKAKLEYNPTIRRMLLKSIEPFTHYYVVAGKKVWTNWMWTAKLWEEIREELKDKQETLDL